MPCVIEIAREPRTLFTHRHRFADSDEPWVTNARKPSMRLVQTTMVRVIFIRLRLVRTAGSLAPTLGNAK